MSPDPDDLAVVLAELRQAHDVWLAAASAFRQAIRVARHFGASWELIGTALGVSRQAAHKRFGAMVGEDVSGGSDL